MPRQRPGTRYGCGEAALIEAATHPDVDIVVIASAGHAALKPAYEAIRAGKAIALANKELIVCAGQIIMPLVRELGVSLRPVDSEHSAIWQSLGTYRTQEISRLVLTASGGPFRTTPLDELETMTVADALRHPTWSMGDKITIDSATMANKGLELIEARWLFDVEPTSHRGDDPSAKHHPFAGRVRGWKPDRPDELARYEASHSAGAHLSGALAKHAPAARSRLGRHNSSSAPLEDDRFPAFGLAREAIAAGGSYPTAYSIADELAVAAFLRGEIGFTDIARTLAQTARTT